MQKIILMLTGWLAAGCISVTSEPDSPYDLGPLPATDLTLPRPLPALSMAEPRAMAWTEARSMTYRLAYINEQQMHRYANSRWTMPPVLLLSPRLKSRLAQSGAMVLSAADSAVDMPVLQIDVDDFTQVFSSTTQSEGRIVVRASLFKGRALIAQKTFSQQKTASSSNAAGGAQALAMASDALVADMMAWLALSVPRP